MLIPPVPEEPALPDPPVPLVPPVPVVPPEPPVPGVATQPGPATKFCVRLVLRLFRLTTVGVNEQGPDGWTEYEPGFTLKLYVPVAVVVRTPWVAPFRLTLTPLTGLPAAFVPRRLRASEPGVPPLFGGAPPHAGPEPSKLTTVLAVRLTLTTVGAKVHPVSDGWTEYPAGPIPLKA